MGRGVETKHLHYLVRDLQVAEVPGHLDLNRQHIRLSTIRFNNYLQELLANFQNSIFLSCKMWPLHLPNPFLATRWLLAVKSQCNSTRGAGGLAGLRHLLQPDPGGSQQCPAWSNAGQPRSGSRPQPSACARDPPTPTRPGLDRPPPLTPTPKFPVVCRSRQRLRS